MKNKSIIALVYFMCIINSAIAYSTEERFAYDLFCLVHNSSVIIVVKPLESERDFRSYTRRFLIIDRIKIGKLDLPDTITITGLDMATPHNHSVSIEGTWKVEYYSFNSFDFFVFFGDYNTEGSSNIFHPIHTGVRAFINDTLFLPCRSESNEPLSLYKKEIINPQNFIQKIYRTIDRLNNLLELHNIVPISEQNKSLLVWTEKNLINLKKSSPFFVDCLEEDSESNWGDMEQVIHGWLKLNGIKQDEERFLQMLKKAEKDIYRPQIAISPHFTDLEARQYLCVMLIDSILSEPDLGRVLFAIKKNLSIDYYTPRRVRLHTNEQSRIVNLMLPLLKHDKLHIRELALDILEMTIHAYNSENKAFYNVIVLSKLKLLMSYENNLRMRVHYNEIITQLEYANK